MPRITAEFHLHGSVSGDVRVIDDRDDAAAIARGVLNALHVGANPQVALGNYAWSESAVALQKLLPDVIFSNANTLMYPLRHIKAQEEIDVMRQAGAVTEAAFTDVLAKLHHRMTENKITVQYPRQNNAG